MKPLVFGTRGSELALAQTRAAAAALQSAHPRVEVAERIIRTTGDRRLDVVLSRPGALDKGLFTKELEAALASGEIDAAVHSLKDLPVEMPDGLAVAAVLPRESPADVLVSKTRGGLAGLPIGARVATGSLRRRCFLRWKRPDLEIVELRGNVPTRIAKLVDDPTLDAIVLAAAGLARLESAAAFRIPPGLFSRRAGFMLPAPGQGAVAVQIRSDDRTTRSRLRALHDPLTEICVSAERWVLSGLGGGCHTPLGVLASLRDDRLALQAAWFEGNRLIPVRASNSIPASEWKSGADALIQKLHAKAEK